MSSCFSKICCLTKRPTTVLVPAPPETVPAGVAPALPAAVVEVVNNEAVVPTSDASPSMMGGEASIVTDEDDANAEEGSYSYSYSYSTSSDSEEDLSGSSDSDSSGYSYSYSYEEEAQEIVGAESRATEAPATIIESVPVPSEEPSVSPSSSDVPTDSVSAETVPKVEEAAMEAPTL